MNDSTANLKPESIEIAIDDPITKEPSGNSNGQPKSNETKQPVKLSLNIKNALKNADDSVNSNGKQTNNEEKPEPSPVKPLAKKAVSPFLAALREAKASGKLDDPPEEPVKKVDPVPVKPVAKKAVSPFLQALRDAQASGKLDGDASNASDINSSKQLLVGAKDDKEGDKLDGKELDGPPLTRGDSGKKSTFSFFGGKAKVAKGEKDATETKRVNSIKQKLLDEETDATDVDDTFSKDRLKCFKQKVHLILYHPECSNWVI